jgi:hypothetical protein
MQFVEVSYSAQYFAKEGSILKAWLQMDEAGAYLSEAASAGLDVGLFGADRC